MILKNLFKKNTPEAPSLELYSGMRVEVVTFDERLLFVAKLTAVKKNEGELQQYSETDLSPDTEPLRVKIRGYSDEVKKAVYLEGTIHPLPKEVWRVEELTLIKVENDRAFFRLDLNLDATYTKVGKVGESAKPCKLVNISVGGVCIRMKDECHKRDKLLLNMKLLEDRGPSMMLCEVLRITPKEDAVFEYGCHFLSLSESDKERITQNIFDIQRKKRRFR